MSIVSTEIALFVSMEKAIAACHAACNRTNIQSATPHRKYTCGELKGYWVCLELVDGTLTEMSEDYAIEIFK